MKKRNKTVSLSKSLQDSISTETTSIITHAADIGVGIIMGSDIGGIPLISTAVSIYRIGNSIKERHSIKKLALFLSELNERCVDEEKREHYKKKIMDNPKQRDKELERILIIIDRFIQDEKANMLAVLYLNYLDGRVDWVGFTKYAEVIDRFLPGDFETLKSSSAYKTKYDLETDSLQRLIALGLVIEGFRSIATQEEDGTLSIYSPRLIDKKERNYTRTEFGNLLVKMFAD